MAIPIETISPIAETVADTGTGPAQKNDIPELSARILAERALEAGELARQHILEAESAPQPVKPLHPFYGAIAKYEKAVTEGERLDDLEEAILSASTFEHSLALHAPKMFADLENLALKKAPRAIRGMSHNERINFIIMAGKSSKKETSVLGRLRNGFRETLYHLFQSLG